MFSFFHHIPLLLYRSPTDVMVRCEGKGSVLFPTLIFSLDMSEGQDGGGVGSRVYLPPEKH